ncbi:MAG: S-layer homology domain-containing protein [Cyanobacteria bacterium J06649_4]
MSVTTTLRPTIQLGSQGATVSELQNLLNLRLDHPSLFGFVIPLLVDGDFGNNTRRAVIAYQEHYALTPDGIVGDRTWTSLLQGCFHDSQGHWAANPICVLANMGIVAGDGSGNFNPNADITRAQFALVVMAAFESVLPIIREGHNFSDVRGGGDTFATTYNPAINSAYRTGVMSGFSDGTFRLHDSIRRQDMYVSLVRILGTLRSGGPIDSLYDDANLISDYARNPLALATFHEIVVNYPTISQLNPQTSATRGEVAATLARAIVQHVNRQKQFGNDLNLGFSVPQAPVETGFTVSPVVS